MVVELILLISTALGLGVMEDIEKAYYQSCGYEAKENIGKTQIEETLKAATLSNITSGFAMDDNFYLGWGFENNQITFLFQCYNIQGWCGIDFVKGMSHSEMMIVINNGGKLQVNDYYCTSNSKPTDLVTGCLTLIPESSSVNSKGITAYFTRPLKCSDSRFETFAPGLATPLSWAYLTSNKGFDKHNSKGEGDIVFGQTNATSSWISGGSDDEDFFKDHGTMMSVMWAGIIQLAIIFVRYFKWWPFAGAIHSILGCTAAIFTLITAYEAFKKDKNPFDALRQEKTLNYHSRLAFTMCALSLGQVFLGFFCKYVQVFKKSIRMSALARVCHAVLGWSIPIMAMVNVKYGWKLKDEESKMTNYIYPAYGVLIAAIVLLEIRFRWGSYIYEMVGKKRVKQSRSESMGSLIDGEKRVRHIDVYKEIVDSKKQWVFCDDMLLDVSLFKYNHPGGFFMFQKVYGQDIGKFINGCSSPDDTRPYYHTESARDMLKHLKIKNMAYASEVFDQVGAGESFESMQWSLANKVQIAKSTYCLEFTSPIWQMKAQPPGYEWMGKHFQVKAKIGGKVIRRYYSLCAVNLASWANEVRSHGFSTKEYSIAQNKNHLRLHLKHYRGGLMTTHLTEIPTGSFVTLKGPLGPGLLIDSEIENDYLVFGAGTGILPFLDIIYAIWCGRLPKAILHVYCSFRDDESSFAVELIEATAKRYPANIKLYARAGEAGFQLHSEFWRNILPLHGAKMAWICGPPPFNRKIIKILKGEGFKADNIIVI